jgi:putative flippase GtrA
MMLHKNIYVFGGRGPKSRLYRFLMIGLLNTCVGYALFAFFVWIGVPYPAAIGLSTTVGVCFNFITSGRFVFDNTSNSRVGRFFLVYGVIYFTNLGLITALLTLDVNIYLAYAITLPPIAVATYFLQLNFVFKPS